MSNLQPQQFALQLHPAPSHYGSRSAWRGLAQPKVHNHYSAPSEHQCIIKPIWAETRALGGCSAEPDQVKTNSYGFSYTG